MIVITKELFRKSLFILLAVFLLAACASPVTVEEVAEPTVPAGETTGDQEGTGGEGGELTEMAYEPPAEEDCEQLAENIRMGLGAGENAVETEAVAQFLDVASNQGGTGCQIRITGTGSDFINQASFADIMNSISGIFAEIGFTVDPAYAADGPTGTFFAMRRENELAFVQIDAQPEAGVECPQGQPITACNLQPDQVSYTIQINYAERNE